MAEGEASGRRSLPFMAAALVFSFCVMAPPQLASFVNSHPRISPPTAH